MCDPAEGWPPVQDVPAALQFTAGIDIICCMTVVRFPPFWTLLHIHIAPVLADYGQKRAVNLFVFKVTCKKSV